MPAPNASDDPNAYPEEWGYKPPGAGALSAAMDVYLAGLSDDEFADLVSRTRDGGK